MYIKLATANRRKAIMHNIRLNRGYAFLIFSLSVNFQPSSRPDVGGNIAPMAPFKSFKRVNALRKPKKSNDKDLQFFIVYQDHNEPGKRFCLRKKTQLHRWNSSLKTNGYLEGTLTPDQRQCRFQRKCVVDETFRIFASTGINIDT